MSKPTYQQVHIDVPLTNLSIAYSPGGFIADQVFPAVPVQRISDKYFTYTKADWLRREAKVRAAGTRAARGDYGLSTSTYVCIERAIAKGVPDEIVANANDPLRPLEDATRWCVTQIQLEKEYQVAYGATGAGSNWSSSATPTVLWSNATADIIGDVETGVNTIVSSIGLEPSVAVAGRGLWKYIKQSPDIIDRIKYSAGPNSPAIATVNACAALFGVGKLLVGSAVYETAAENATSSMSYLWGNHMLIAYVTGAPSLLEPSAGYIFTYESRRTERFREDQEHQDVVTVFESFDTRATATDSGYLIKSAA